MRPLFAVPLVALTLACSDLRPSERGAGGNGNGGAGATGGMGGGEEPMGGDPVRRRFDASSVAVSYVSANDHTVVVAERAAQGGDVDRLTVELFYGLGADPGAHSASLGDNYADCHTCALVFVACDQNAQCVAALWASSGTLTVNANNKNDGEPFRATLSDARFDEVTIDPNSFESTPVAGGISWCIDSITLDATVMVR
jgi:hypothetical protein